VKRPTAGEREAARFNERCAPGGEVTYWSGLREGPGVKSRTASAAYAPSPDHASVFVEGRAASVACSHVRPKRRRRV
jgi:hypothetical protein